MKSDVKRLFQSIGVAEGRYREVASIERGQGAAARWPLLAATDKLLAERAPSLPAKSAPPRRRRAFTIAVISLRGGSGRTTVAANLAATLSQQGRRALAVDADPQNALQLHFGVDPSEGLGLSHKGVLSRDVAQFLVRFRGGAGCIPFGRLTAHEAVGLELATSLEPDWLRARLDDLVPPEAEVVVLDTPAAPSPWTEQALAMSDATLVLLRPDAASYATLPAVEDLLDASVVGDARANARYLVNGYDERRELDRDVLAALRGQLSGRALPFFVHADDVVAEALARRRLLTVDGGASQAVADLRVLAEWVEQQVEKLAGARTSASVPAR
jgi:cellulose synthase operon protein YhjQ